MIVLFWIFIRHTVLVTDASNTESVLVAALSLSLSLSLSLFPSPDLFLSLFRYFCYSIATPPTLFFYLLSLRLSLCLSFSLLSLFSLIFSLPSLSLIISSPPFRFLALSFSSCLPYGVFTLGDYSRYRSRECARVFARPVARPVAHRLLDLEELWAGFTAESSPPAPPIAVESPEFVPPPRMRTSTRAKVAEKSRKITARSVAQISPNTRHHFPRPPATVHEYGRPCTTVDDLTAML